MLLYLFCEGQQCCAPSNSQCQVIKRGIFQKDYCSKLLRSIFGEKKYLRTPRQRLNQSLCNPNPSHSLPVYLSYSQASLTWQNAARQFRAPIYRCAEIYLCASCNPRCKRRTYIINALFFLFKFNSYLQSITYRCSSIDFSNVASKGSGCALSGNDNSVASNWLISAALSAHLVESSSWN